MNQELDETKKELLQGMLRYIEDDDDPPYTSSDVEECGAILDQFISEVMESEEKGNFDWVKSKVKELILVLNAFNEKHKRTIIETDQREGIYDLISKVMEGAGHHVSEDITEEWREW